MSDIHTGDCQCSACQYYDAVAQAREAHWAAKYRAWYKLYGQPDGSTFQMHHDQLPSTGEYRRIQDPVYDVINFQYRPWPEAKWDTYFTLTMERVVKTTIIHSLNVMADGALREARYYKVERIEEPAKA